MTGRIASAFLAAALFASAADFSKHFEGVDGTFVLRNGRTGQTVRHNPARAAQRFPPCSTFKIPNSAIALETGVAPGPDFTLPYNPALKLKGDWARDHTLASAFRVSALWYYQEIARRVGAKRMFAWLRRFEYGNQQIAGAPVDRFWIGAPLRISADEQVRFLERLRNGQLGLSDRTTGLMREITVAEKGQGWTLHAKTGACRAEGEPVALWYVGWVERGADIHYFALQMGAAEYQPLMGQRVGKAKAILREAGVLPRETGPVR